MPAVGLRFIDQGALGGDRKLLSAGSAPNSCLVRVFIYGVMRNSEAALTIARGNG